MLEKTDDGSSKAYDGRAIAAVDLLMTFSICQLPMLAPKIRVISSSSQDIEASFDSNTELTTITWRNIDSLDEPSALDNFYNLFTKSIDTQSQSTNQMYKTQPDPSS